jgi:hypothetical protein
MRTSMRVLGLVGLALVLLAGVAVAGTGQCVAAQGAEGPKTPRLESNELFVVKSPTHVVFREGVDFEVVKTPEGRSLIRINYEGLSLAEGEAAAALECRCQFPTVCTRSSCKESTTGGSATCDGGCYKPDGTPCVSCAFFTVEPKPKEP